MSFTSPRLPAALIAVTLLLAASGPRLLGYAVEGQSWPTGSAVAIRLGLGAPKSGHLQDGFITFDALAAWKQYINLIGLSWLITSAPGGHDDRLNQAFFASTVYGQIFGTGVLAITLTYSDDTTIFEADNVFNSALQWDSYRGLLQYHSKTRQYVFDFHRVALHEFGHSLGLPHPDEVGQSVTAIMNSRISDLDHLADDDIAGIKSLYERLMTTASTGSPFSFQLAVANSPTSFTAGQLPTGLRLNSSTGVISGVPTLSGVYDIQITAIGPQRNFTFPLRITVTAPPNSGAGQLLKTFDYLVNRLALDPKRPRLYATVQNLNSVLVIDTDNLSVVRTIPVGSSPLGLALSADNSRLWVANSDSSDAGITGIDLDTQNVFTVTTPYPADYVVEGVNARLFATSPYGIMEVDTATRTYKKTWEYVGELLTLSQDRKTLYAADRGSSPSTLISFDIPFPMSNHRW
jgi:YVTN family beta-propeller protein